MKKNNGSLQLWLWTITPLLLIVCAPYEVISFIRLERTPTYCPLMATYTFAALTLISPFVRHYLLMSERDNISAAALKRLRYAFNIAWSVLFLSVIAATVLWMNEVIWVINRLSEIG